MGCGSSSDAATHKPHAKAKALPKEKKIDWQALEAKMPTDSSNASKEARKQLWKEFDVNGNDFLSLAELDKVRTGERESVKILCVSEARRARRNNHQCKRRGLTRYFVSRRYSKPSLSL